MVEYPTRPIIQLLYAVNMLPVFVTVVIWGIKSHIAGTLALLSALFMTIRVFITQQDAKFLSGQCGLMSNLFTLAFMVYTAFHMPLSYPQRRKSVAVIYGVCQLLLIHYLGRYLQTGSDAAVRLFQTIGIILNLYYASFALDDFKGQFSIEWVTNYSA